MMNAISDQQDIKREKILEAANYRFLHFGYSKTTMNEIAGDLFMSKALLYYYFPDKSQLYIAVMKRVADNYLKLLEANIGNFSDLREAFMFQIKTQHEFILNNYNFFDFFRLNEQNLPDPVWEMIDKVRRQEVNLLVNAINTEIAKGKINPVEKAEEVVGLLLDALQGVSSSASPHKKAIFHQKEQLVEVYKKKLLLADIFTKGLMYCI